MFSPNLASYREKEAEVERATKAYKGLGEKRAVGFLAGLNIDLRVRVEVLKELNSCRYEDSKSGELGEFHWKPEGIKDKFTPFGKFIAEELERGKRKLVDQKHQKGLHPLVVRFVATCVGCFWEQV